MRIGAGLSEHHDPRVAAIEAGQEARAALGGAPCDLALAFVAGSHLAAPAATIEGLREALAPAALAGCGAGGVLAGGREVERGTAIAVWAASFGEGGTAEVAHVAGSEVDGALVGMPDLAGASGVVLLTDPYSFPAEAALGEISAAAPGTPVLGGLASARAGEAGATLFIGDEVAEEGAVAVVFRGVEMLPAVSQGAAPVGPELTITAADGPLIRELAGAPALEKLREVLDGLSPHDQLLLSDGLLLGIVVDQGQPEYGPGDFLVRSLLGADPETGAVAVGAEVEAGQVVRLHARDAASADQDLHEALELHRAALGGRTPAGALVFSCNGRGTDLFGIADHDARAVDVELNGAPAAGFFAAGEIGPVAGHPFLHAFTATLAVFPP